MSGVAGGLRDGAWRCGHDGEAPMNLESGPHIMKKGAGRKCHSGADAGAMGSYLQRWRRK